MDSSRLSSFYRAATEWPKNEADLAFLSEKVRKLLDCPVVFIWVPSLGSRMAGFQGTDDSLPGSFGLVLQRQARQFALDSTKNPVRKVRLASEANLLRDGTRLDHLTAAPILTEQESSQRDAGWVISVSDQPLSPQAEMALVAAAEHLSSLALIAKIEKAISQRDQFLSIASHELKTPLTSIYGILQLQERLMRPKEGEKLSPEQERQYQFFKMVIRQTERLNDLIDDLLDVSRIHNGRFMVEPSDVEVASILREAINSRLGVIAKEAGVDLHVDAPESLTAWVDPVRFEEVVTNLGMNAIRFSPEGGMVWVRLREDEGGIVLSFRDQGPAVPEADRSRIFEPFERAQRTSRLGGLGLGLFISRQIAQLHGGNVTLVESLPGKGNLFEARFPGKRRNRASA